MRDEKLKSLQSQIVRLHNSVHELSLLYPQKKFTLDGRLVGDIGEVIVEELFDITLYDKLEKYYDAYASYDEKIKIQIKATFKESLTYNHSPDYYIGIKLFENGEFKIVYNGPGKYIHEAFAHRKNIGRKLLSFPIEKLKYISDQIDQSEKIIANDHAFYEKI
tara:strand:+ start:7556 stop:8044 length:489 start_codon:yes stop_codon:yes gene_type:complete